MENLIEKELKYRVNKNDFIRIYKYLSEKYSVKDTIKQMNYYLESGNGLLGKNKISARLREIDGEVFEYTVKIKLKKNKNLSVKNEFTYPLSKEDFDFIKREGIKKNNNLLLKPILESTDLIINEDINVIGHMLTERTYFKICDFIEPMNLDKSNYLDQEDYEIEWETEKLTLANEVLDSIFEIVKVIPLELYHSKNERFQLAKGGEETEV